MARETPSIPFEEFSNHIADFFERVVRDHETIMVEDEEGKAALLTPAPASVRSRHVARRKKPSRTAADREAFLLSLGGWKDLVDTDRLIQNINESRNISAFARYFVERN